MYFVSKLSPNIVLVEAVKTLSEMSKTNFYAYRKFSMYQALKNNSENAGYKQN